MLDSIRAVHVSLGIDYGTNSVRALLVDCANGQELASHVVDYPSGNAGVFLDSTDHHLARQSPLDYLFGLEESVKGTLAKARSIPGFTPDSIVALGVDATGSSPIPVDARNKALGELPAWKDNPHAQCWLWKDHTSHREAEAITALAQEIRPQFIAKCGNVYSSEWFWSKIWRCSKVAPDVFDAAFSWIELADWIPSILAGISDPRQVRRGVCMAGHKALYSDEWGGLPDEEFLGLLDPKLAALRPRLYVKAYDANELAGSLCETWAARLNLRAGIPIAIGEMDVHYGAIGCGVKEGSLIKVIGTSTCDCGVISADKTVADIPGICGIVKGAILPGYYGIEAGQSAVGDIFKWWTETICGGDASTHRQLTEQASSLRPGQSGLLALDWNNGNRTILVDPLLTGLVLGQTLYTSRAEIYRALIEATAFGARAIIERLREYGVQVNEIICAGGIAEKNALAMQIYADVTGCTIRIAGSSQACALGAAVAGSVIAGIHPDFPSAQRAMTSLKEESYQPSPTSQSVYDSLFALYKTLHDAFGGVSTSSDLTGVMKDLISIKEYSVHEKPPHR